METNDPARAEDATPLADLAAEAVNDGAPAQSVPESILPEARRDRGTTIGKKNDSGAPVSAPAADIPRRGEVGEV